MKLTLLLLILVVHQAWAATNCDAPGSFRVARDPTCKKYFTCRLVMNYYIKDDFSCGLLQQFNPTTQQCDYGSICIDSLCDNQLPLVTLRDPNAIDPACPSTVIKCEGIINQYPTIVPCPNPNPMGCC